MRRQIEHVRLQWLGFKAPTSATRPGVAYRIVSRRNVDISRRAQLVSSTRIHFRIRRNQKWPCQASKPLDDHDRSDPSLHKRTSHALPSREVRRGSSAAMPRQAAEEARRTPTPARRTLPPPSVAAPVSPAPLRLLDQPPVGGENRGDRRLRRGSAGRGGEGGGRKHEARRKR